MKANAIYRHEVMDDGREVHAVDHDGGGFVVSSEKVGVAAQNFLNNATSTDILTLHHHLLHAFKRAWNEESEIDADRCDHKWRVYGKDIGVVCRDCGTKAPEDIAVQLLGEV